MKLNALLAGAAIALATSFAAASANAQIVNGSFETGDLTGWTGGNFGVSANESGYTPTQGAYMASGYAGCGGDTPCTLSQTFTTAGGLFSGDAAFLAHDYNPFNDWAFVNLFDGASTTTLFYSDVATVGDFGSSGWTHFATNIGAGTYTVTIGVANRYDNAASSQVIADHFSVAGVPEPASWALMLTGFLGAGTVLRANRRRTAVAATA